MPTASELIAQNLELERKRFIAAIKSFKNADTEFNRARQSGEQPRLNKAGTRYAIAKIKLFKLIP